MTIDNLWKILATEKNLPQPTAALAEKQRTASRSRSRNNNEAAKAGSRANSGTRPFGITINDDGQGMSRLKQRFTPPQQRHASRQDSDFFATPTLNTKASVDGTPQQVQSQNRGQPSPIRFMRDPNSAAGVFQSQQNDNIVFNTALRDSTEVGDRTYSRHALGQSANVREEAQGGYLGDSRTNLGNFAPN